VCVCVCEEGEVPILWESAESECQKKQKLM